MRRNKSWFFSLPGQRLSPGSTPSSQTFKDEADSLPFIADVADTAKVSEQGLAKLDTDTDVMLRTTPTAGDFAKVTQGYQLPEVITANVSGDTDDNGVAQGGSGYAPSIVLTGRGLKITYLKRTIGSLFRRVFKIENTLILQSSDTTIDVSESVPGTVDMKLKLTSTGGTITPTKIEGGYNIEANIGQGPSGENSVALSKTNDALVLCDSAGTPSVYSTVLVKLYDGTTHVDMSGYNLNDTNVFNPIVSNCAATYSHSGFDILITLTGATADTGYVNAQIKYLGNWYSVYVSMMKVKSGVDGNSWNYRGILSTAPASPSYYWWYKNSNGYSYFYDVDNTWKILFTTTNGGPTNYITLTNAGLILTLTSADVKTQIIHVPAGVVLAGPITISTTGTFPDGFEFNVIFDGGFNNNVQAVTVLGNSITSGQCWAGFKVNAVYSITDTLFKTFVFYVPIMLKGYLTQDGTTNPPTMTISKNTLGYIPALQYRIVGGYRVMLDARFNSLNCLSILGSVISYGRGFSVFSAPMGIQWQVDIDTADSSGTPQNGLLAYTPIYIELT